ncbi:exopolysaccharide biosynthesis GT4 family glycosyltransferase EpsE [Cellulomonas hominis]|uniref:exopolysaccharide biosynthesis GT4 family glycosyltransferase EpsE n=1 Tax=Cellulomonas hominis TaxID=156981 RepID=UPI001B974897|nr:exopolysaccharide biosynthesis GT4 family glycosyltransferase EpsE [Cellulomonas hominis]VTR78525.1 Alpha-D-kanosaminyltransferase [Cellulomonas hominis]
MTRGPAPVRAEPRAPAADLRAPSRPARGVVLGYLVPEFPGQTHAFFWREVAALRRAGAEPVLVSTRRPRGAAAHAWAPSAAARTRYLTDWSPRGAAAAVAVLAGSLRGPRRRDVAREARASAADGGVARTAALMLAAAHLAAVARRERWQHLHVHSCGRAAQVAALAHALTGLRYSLSLHGPLADYGGNQRGKWRGAAFGLVITEGLRRDVAVALAGDLPPVVAVAPMGVDPVRFARAAPYAPWAPPGRLRVVSCGRLNPSKGHDDLVRAVRLLTDAGRDVELVVAGEDEQGGAGYRRDLEALIDRSGLGGRVRLLGSVGEDEVRAQLERAHVFALASHAEPLGVAIMEAMALELPVVVGAGGGIGALVEDGVTGLLVPPRDPSGIAAALARAADDPVLAVALGAHARRHVVAAFSSERGARTLLDLVERSTTEGSRT